MLDRAIEGNSAWRRRDVRPEDYRISLSPACHDELRRVADEMRRFPLPTIVRHPDEFDLPQCRATMAAVRDVLDRGVRFAVLDRLPLDELGAEAVAVYWLLSSMLARPVAQKLDGTLIYDVLDTGRAALPGSGVAAKAQDYRDPMLVILQGIGPRDGIERLLAVQTAWVRYAGEWNFLARANGGRNAPCSARE